MAVKVNLNAKGGAKQIEYCLRNRSADLLKMAAIEFFRQAIIATPVDTGRARMGWNATINEPSNEVPAPAPAGHKGKSKGGSEYYPMPKIKASLIQGVVKITDKIFITNRVPYIEELNDGSSKQAPARFVERAAKRVQAAVSKLWKQTSWKPEKRS